MALLKNWLFLIFGFAVLFFAPFFLMPSKGGEKKARFEFTSTSLPQKVGELLEPYTKSVVRISYPDGSTKEIPLSYKTLFKSGDVIGGGTPAGAIVDKTGYIINNWNLGAKGEFIRRGPIHAAGPDGNTLVNLKAGPGKNKNGSIFHLITHFEHHTWVTNQYPDRMPVDMDNELPMVINLTSLEQEPNTGYLKPFELININASEVGGVWKPCASTLTPWNTHLGSEEYEPNAKWYEHRPLEPMNLFLNSPGKLYNQEGANPYQYGFPIEVTPSPDGSVQMVKRYALGRISLEMVEIMPDQRTAYMTDDAADGVRLMFVADKVGDLSSGTIYASEWIQFRKANKDQAKLQWIRLGHSSEKIIESFIDDDISFSDIFEEAPFFFSTHNKSLFSGFKPIYVFNGHMGVPKNDDDSLKIIRTVAFPINDKAEFLKVKPNMEKAAAFLETRRFAALKGATTEFTKLEGQALNKRDKKLYTAVSSAKKGMLAGNNYLRFQDHIQLSGKPEDLECGIVYESDLKANMKDSEGNSIDSDWVATNMIPLLEGKAASTGSTFCDWGSIANPDNIKFSESMRTLFIAEDSGGNHPADFLWAYSPDSKTLTRILVGPKNSELTGLQVTDDYNGFVYIMGNFQKGLDEEKILSFKTPRKANEFVASQDVRGTVGYLQPIPVNLLRLN